MPRNSEAYRLLQRGMSGKSPQLHKPGTTMAAAYVRAASTLLTSDFGRLRVSLKAQHLQKYPLGQLVEHARLFAAIAAELEILISAAVTCLHHRSWSRQPGSLRVALTEALRWADALELANAKEGRHLLGALVYQAAQREVSFDAVSESMLVLHQHSGPLSEVVLRAWGLVTAERSTTDQSLATTLRDRRNQLVRDELHYTESGFENPTSLKDIRKRLASGIKRGRDFAPSVLTHNLIVQSFEQIQSWSVEDVPIEHAIAELAWLYDAAYALGSIKDDMTEWQAALGRAGLGKDFRGWFVALEILSHHVECSDCIPAASAWLKSSDRSSSDFDHFVGDFAISLKWAGPSGPFEESEINRLRISAAVRENNISDAFFEDPSEILRLLRSEGEAANACLVEAIEQLILYESSGLPCFSRNSDYLDDSDFHAWSNIDVYADLLSYLIERFGELSALERVVLAAKHGEDARELVAEAIIESEQFDLATPESLALLESLSGSYLAKGILRKLGERRDEEDEGDGEGE